MMFVTDLHWHMQCRTEGLVLRVFYHCIKCQMSPLLRFHVM